MKRLILLLGAAALLWGCETTEFLAYSGAQQNWPTAPGAMVRQNLAVPVYYGLPPRPYTVLGEIATPKGQTWAWSDVQSEAMEQAAVEAKKRGADAIIVISATLRSPDITALAQPLWLATPRSEAASRCQCRPDMFA